MQPINLSAIRLRTQLITVIRQFFHDREYTEIIVPVLHSGLPLEPTLYSFTTQWQTTHTRSLYLATSPEASLKKMMAAGIGNCYALGKSFRNLEQSGRYHQPEFLMLEWYQEDATYLDIMTQTQQLLGFIVDSLDVPQLQAIAKPESWQKLSLVDLFSQYAGLDLSVLLSVDDMRTAFAAKGYQVGDSTWEQMFNQVFLNDVEPHLPATPFFLTDFPAQISPLCQPQSDRPWLAERFELYINGIELGNGNTELLDADRVARHFHQESEDRLARGEPSHPIDQDFLDALHMLAATGKQYAGIGLGVDRLSMLAAGVDSLSEVEPLAVT